MTLYVKTGFASLVFWAAIVAQVQAGVIAPGFNTSTLAVNDDDSTGLVNIGFTTNFFGTNYTQLYVNNNGNITFGSALSSYTPFDLNSTSLAIIAPFFADVDTSSAGNPVKYGQGAFDGKAAFGVTSSNVDYFSSGPTHANRNSFQMILVDRSDIAAGDFDIVFNYDQIQWETGGASGGDSNGLGGNSARVGYSNGSGMSYELPGSAINGAFLNGGPNSLVSGSNVGIDGRYVFQARNGGVTPNPTVPEPTSILIFGTLGLVVVGRRRRAQKQIA